MKKLDYSIYKFSSFSTNYPPENIRENKPSDQTSRWSSETNYPPQYLVLKLQTPAVVDSITFGKYEKTHVCNLRKFKIFGGTRDSCSLELLENGLKNDNLPETFTLRPVIDGHDIPCSFIKIVPLQSWGPSFNFSIWFVELKGIDDWSVVGPCLNWFHQYQEHEVIRLCLKHFREHDYHEAFQALQRQTNISLEDPLITQLHQILVEHGGYEDAEVFMEKAISEGYFTTFLSKQDYRPVWSPLPHTEGEVRPGMRGGHQMCIDACNETIYLFGGWDGNKDINDFWSYHVPTHKWTLISKDTETDGGPSPRSCHKVCLDPDRRQIFTLGRYLDTQYRTTAENLKSDFYVFDIDSKTWTLITEDTAHMGGPQLTFDHQMCMDVEKRTIYVFGGRILTPPLFNILGRSAEDRGSCVGFANVTEVKFSGMYSYHIPTNTWTQLFDDSEALPRPGINAVKSRVGHSMLFHPVYRKLFIFAGQRSKEHLNDFFTYNVDTGEIQQIWEGIKKEGTVPAAGFTQRATIDYQLNEIYVLSGLSKDKEKRDDTVQNSFWVYSIPTNQWTCIYRNENMGEVYWNKMQHVEPCPRFAHQLVYDQVNHVHYLFGGNPGRSYLPKLRLDDFWKLQLTRPSPNQLLHKFKFLIRKHRFEELAMQNSLTALDYLQTTVHNIIDHEDPEQTKEFQQLAAVLFQNTLSKDGGSKSETGIREQRLHLFDRLVEFFPSHMTQPTYSLVDLVQLTTHKNQEPRF